MQVQNALAENRRYFISYSGVKLPLKLVNEISEADTDNRNTYFCGVYDDDGKMLGCEKRVYGEVEMSHQYAYYDSGKLKRATIAIGGEAAQTLDFPEE